MNAYMQCATVITKPGMRDQLVQQLQTSSKLLNDVPECAYYLIGTNENPDAVCITELWTSKDAKDAFAARPDVAAQLKDTFMPLVASIDPPITATIIGGVGV